MGHEEHRGVAVARGTTKGGVWGPDLSSFWLRQGARDETEAVLSSTCLLSSFGSYVKAGLACLVWFEGVD